MSAVCRLGPLTSKVGKVKTFFDPLVTLAIAQDLARGINFIAVECCSGNLPSECIALVALQHLILSVHCYSLAGDCSMDVLVMFATME